MYPWSVEVPIVAFWNKSNIGIDFAIRGGGNDPLGDNVGGRLGVFIPVEVKEGTPIWIEPLVRVGKLFEKKETNFWKDNLVVGFNLSVSITRASKIGSK